MRAFVAMPFNPAFLPVWKVIKAACKTNNIEARRVDQLPQIDNIKTTQIPVNERESVKPKQPE